MGVGFVYMSITGFWMMVIGLIGLAIIFPPIILVYLIFFGAGLIK